MNLQPISNDTIPVDQPLPWPLYDKEGHVMFYDGEEISGQQLQLLSSVLEDGLFRDMGEDVPAAPASEPEEHNAKAKPAAKPRTVDNWVKQHKGSSTGPITLTDIFPPPGIKPQVGERLQLRLLSRSKPVYHYSRLVGYIRGQSILVSAPMEQGNKVDLVDGEALEIRMLTGGDIFLFRSSVLASCISPTHYLHLEYPTQITRQKLRKHPWAKVEIDSAIVDENGKRYAAKITNLSNNGAKLVSASPLGREHDPVRLNFPVTIDEIRTDLSLEGTIRRVGKADEQKDVMEYGIELHNIPDDHALWLRCLVFERIAKGFPT